MSDFVIFCFNSKESINYYYYYYLQVSIIKVEFQFQNNGTIEQRTMDNGKILKILKCG